MFIILKHTVRNMIAVHRLCFVWFRTDPDKAVAK